MGLRRTIDQSIKSSNFNLMLVSVAAIIVGVIAFVGVGRAIYVPNSNNLIVGTSRYMLRWLNAPQTLTGEQVVAITADNMPLYNVRITGTKMQDSEYTEYTTKYGKETTTAYFGYFWVNHKFLIVRSLLPIDENLLTYTGTLGVPVNVSKKVYDDVINDFPDVEVDRLPFILYLDSNPMPWFLGAAVELVLVLGGAVGVVTAYARRNPHEHPIIKNLARYGDVNKVIDEIDAEMKAGKIAKVYLLQFTRSWLIYKAGTELYFVRYRDLMWAHERTVTRRQRYGGEIVEHYLYIYERNGNKLSISGEHKDVRRMMMAVGKQAPWIETGYEADIERAWKKDRAGFARSIDDRREQMSQ